MAPSHSYRSQSLPIIRSGISDSEMDLDVSVYRDNCDPQVRASPTPDDVSLVEESVGSNAVAHAVGQVPELVDLVLSFAHRPLLHTCLFVCKGYSCIAKKYLWRLLPSAIPLFNLLGPIITTEQLNSYFDCWAFRAPPSELQWENFRTYAKYVKTIAQPPSWSRGTTDQDWSLDLELMQSFGDSESEDSKLLEDYDYSTDYQKSDICPISEEALAMLEAQKPKSIQSASVSRLPLAPNLERLAFTFGNSHTPPTAFLPFLSPSLASLDLLYHVCGRIFQNRDETFRIIKHISESLQALAASSSNRSPLPSLHRLHICLGDEELSMFRGYEQINRAVLDILDKCRELQEVQLPPFQRQDHLLSRLQDLLKLRSITVSFSNPEEMILFAEGIVSTHPDLCYLKLGHHAYSPTPMDVLKPLRKLRSLVKLSIESSWAFTSDFPQEPSWFLSPTLLQDLSDAWPKLESLALCPSNYIDLRSFESFQDSNLFPHLTRLALDIDDVIQEPPTRKAVAAAVRSIRPLRSLRWLEIDTPTDTILGTGNTFALMTYAERIGSSKMEIFLNEDAP
ncbi:hypothetical protein M407DRAFT_9365 [Tulasnella calospora MUT 4182]|uniref:Uncharacterized protein n=1 Tax=Tulasnella calospora MUT 4182 TaxID=1051891 RepID=A0A0C3QDC2_9AGAM|nr:hypothetical protein M407DRAFT_9365 [Tulasnella calospora MUT 4182]